VLILSVATKTNFGNMLSIVAMFVVFLVLNVLLWLSRPLQDPDAVLDQSI
jgi:hypothetical protein